MVQVTDARSLIILVVRTADIADFSLTVKVADPIPSSEGAGTLAQ
jgi:hypothetical protein